MAKEHLLFSSCFPADTFAASPGLVLFQLQQPGEPGPHSYRYQARIKSDHGFDKQAVLSLPIAREERVVPRQKLGLGLDLI